MSQQSISDPRGQRKRIRARKTTQQKRAQKEDFMQRPTPRRINLELMNSYDDHWGDLLPESADRAIGRCLLVIAQLETHDPLVLRRATGYPLPFLTALVYVLLNNEQWKGFGGCIELQHCVDEFPAYWEGSQETLFHLIDNLRADSTSGPVDPFGTYQELLVPLDYQRPILTAFSL
jgi:hypothetical protein